LNPNAIDLATKHQIIADRILGDCDDIELAELVVDLLALYRHSARRLRSQLGLIAVDLALHEIATDDFDYSRQSAAKLIIATGIAADGPSVEADLRQIGWDSVRQLTHVISVTGRTLAVVAAIPAIWRQLLPELSTPSGRQLLEHFAYREMT
jgi:hypothetical protein